jgi:hypothetical protein
MQREQDVAHLRNGGAPRLVLVQPDTVVRWHRDWLRRRWSRRSSRPQARPPVDSRIVARSKHAD